MAASERRQYQADSQATELLAAEQAQALQEVTEWQARSKFVHGQDNAA
jgi:hypothetical protein